MYEDKHRDTIRNRKKVSFDELGFETKKMSSESELQK